MKKIARIIYTVLLSAAFINISLYSFAEEGGAQAAELIKEAKMYIERDDKERAISILDAAFESASSAGDYKSLMQIGDLYIGVDSSLKEKAMEAWTAAGRLKCR